MSGGIQMQAVKAISWRGLRNYFESPAAYVILFVFYLLVGYLFVLPLFLMGQATMKGMMDFVPLILTFLVPALTMGLLAEELKSGTFESLATQPIEDWDIALGKYLGFAGLLLAAVGGLFFFVLALAALVQPTAGLDWGESVGVLSGLYLLGLAYGAVGLFASSLTRNQIVAFVLAFVMCFILFMCGKLETFFPGALAAFFDYAGVDSHLRSLTHGVFDFRDLFYFASLIFGFLYLTVQRLGSRML